MFIRLLMVTPCGCRQYCQVFWRNLVPSPTESTCAYTVTMEMVAARTYRTMTALHTYDVITQRTKTASKECKCIAQATYNRPIPNFVALSLQANYTDWAAATCRRNLVPTFVDRGVSRSQCSGSPTVINLSFLDWSRYFSFK
jgi:hypothetical protein